MKAVTLIEIPYREHALDYVERLLDQPLPILFDSGRPHSTQGRYDIFSSSPLYNLSYHRGQLDDSRRGGPQPLAPDELISQLNKQLRASRLEPHNLPSLALPFYGGFAGYFGYDLARYWESLPQDSVPDIDMPELLIAYYPWAGVVDHHLQKAYLSFLPDCPTSQATHIQQALQNGKSDLKKFIIINELTNKINVAHYNNSVARIQEYILAGDCYQVNFSQRFSGRYQGSPWEAYRKVRESMYSPFGGYFQTNKHINGDDEAILSFSPERFLHLERGRVLTQPIKGTARRHEDKALDTALATQLQHSEKNRAENLMIVDLLRNDLGKCCSYGSVKTEKLFELQTVSNVHHLVSSISGQLAPDLTAFDLLRATLPGGSITGAPKIRAMEIIDELEPQRRAIYCGSMAYINVNGDMDSNIAIRTALCHGGEIHCWGGGGIVADSLAADEYSESLVKIAPILQQLNSFK